MKIRHALMVSALGLAMAGSAYAADMTLTEAEAVLAAEGYGDVSGLSYEGGVWLGSATSADGKVVDVRIDPANRKVTTLKPGERTTVTTTTTTTAPDEVVERTVEPPAVTTAIIVQERVLVPVGGKIGKEEVRAVLAGNGYTDIHDIDWLDMRGVWKAEARDARGDDREIHVHPLDGSILHNEDD